MSTDTKNKNMTDNTPMWVLVEPIINPIMEIASPTINNRDIRYKNSRQLQRLLSAAFRNWRETVDFGDHVEKTDEWNDTVMLIHRMVDEELNDVWLPERKIDD